MSDILRQVDEDLRKDRLISVWKNYRLFIVLFITIIILITVGFQVISSLNTSKNERLVESYIAAANIENYNISLEKLKAIENNSNEFLSGLIKLKIAQLNSKNGEVEISKLKLKEIFENERYDRLIRDQALYNYIMIDLDKIDRTEINNYLSENIISDSNYKYLYQELLALHALSYNDTEIAINSFKNIINDPSSPPELALRSTKFLDTID